jgi:hypothetical protein
MNSFTLYLPDDVQRRAEKRAELMGLTLGGFIQVAIARELSRPEPAREPKSPDRKR